MTSLKKAILVVSFGTSFDETRVKNIDLLEDEIKTLYPDYSIYSAWTSKMIINKILKRDNKKINTVTDAVQKMILDNVEELIVQPTHVISGIENDIMTEEVLKFKDSFKSIRFGTPLLNDNEDAKKIATAIAEEYKETLKNESLILVGHGSNHNINFAYAALDYTFKEMGYKNVFIGTIEAYPHMEEVLNYMKDIESKKLTIIPFMLVAGDHAVNDIAGEEDDTWRSFFEKAGYSVNCVVKGLGEYKSIRSIYLNHLASVI